MGLAISLDGSLTNTAHSLAKGIVRFSPVDYAVIRPLTNH